MTDPVIEITVTFRVSHFGTESEAIAWCREIGVEPSLLGYIRWLAEEEGLMGVVDDGYEITTAELVNVAEKEPRQ